MRKFVSVTEGLPRLPAPQSSCRRRSWPFRQNLAAQPDCIRQPSQHRVELRVAKRTLPEDEDPPASVQKHGDSIAIAPDVGGKFSFPEFNIAARCRGILAALVSMPVTAVNKHHRTMTRKNQIRSTGQASVMQPKTQSSAMQKASDKHLRPGILATDSGHHARPNFRRHHVCHAAHYSSLRTKQTSLMEAMA